MHPIYRLQAFELVFRNRLDQFGVTKKNILNFILQLHPDKAVLESGTIFTRCVSLPKAILPN